jgi:regulatory protein
VSRRRARSPAGSPQRPLLDAKAAKLAAFELLARKAWSARELAGRLRRRGAPAEVALAVVRELEARGYVDDAAFARWWAEARARGRQVGSRRLRQELLAKDISRDTVAAATGAAFEETSEAALALAAARRRLPALLKGGRERLPGRLRDYLLRRGYPPAIALAAVRALTGAAVEEAEPEPPEEGGCV